jgi:deoxycytidylate deaminase
MQNKHPDLSRNFDNIDQEITYFQNKEFYNFVPKTNDFITAAKNAAIKHSLTSIFPIGIVAVKEGVVMAEAGNGNGYHEANLETPGHRKGCVRRYLNDEREKEGLPKFKSGEGFEFCPGCHADSHAEANLLKNAKESGTYEKLGGADVYMYGHFWCCKPCWEKLMSAGVQNIYLPETANMFKDKGQIAKWAEYVKEEKNKI